jgi:hypothetical protein
MIRVTLTAEERAAVVPDLAKSSWLSRIPDDAWSRLLNAAVVPFRQQSARAVRCARQRAPLPVCRARPRCGGCRRAVSTGWPPLDPVLPPIVRGGRRHLRRMGARWRRTSRTLAHKQDAARVATATQTLDALKRGGRRPLDARLSRRMRLKPQPAGERLLDTGRPAQAAAVRESRAGAGERTGGLQPAGQSGDLRYFLPPNSASIGLSLGLYGGIKAHDLPERAYATWEGLEAAIEDGFRHARQRLTATSHTHLQLPA